MKFNLLVILGPTASGKTRIAVDVARRVDGEIISADSRQVYRSMDIGTGKDLQEYGSIPYHLIDVADPGVEFNVFDFQRLFFEAFQAIHSRARMPLLVGGTGMYLDSVLRRYQFVEVPEDPVLRADPADWPLSSLAERLKKANPNLHNTTDLLDRNRVIRALEIAEYKPEGGQNLPVRPDLVPMVFGIRWPRDILRQRITRRLQERLENGMLEEVRDLIRKGISFETLDFYGLEYRYIGLYLQGKLNRNDMFQKLRSAIHQFAKRQETFFRRMERRGVAIHWVAADENAALLIVKEINRIRQI